MTSAGKQSDCGRAFWLLLGIAFALRILTWAMGLGTPDLYLRPDSTDYLRLANGLLEDGHYGTIAQSELFRVPGYPVFLAAILGLGGGPAVVCLLQVACDLAICVGVWFLAWRWFDERMALWALGFQAVAMVSIVFSCKVLSETLYAALLVGAVALAVELVENRKKSGWKMAVALGLILVASTYLRAVTLLYVGVPVLALALARRWRLALLCGAIFLMGLVPWVARNRAVADYSGFASVSAINLYRYNATLVNAHLTGVPFQTAFGQADVELAKYETQQEKAAFAMAEGKRVLAENLPLAVWLHLKADVNNLLPAVGDWLNFFGASVGGNGTMAVIHSGGLLAGVRHYFGGSLWAAAAALPFAVGLLLTYFLVLLGVGVELRARRQLLLHLTLLLTIGYFLLVPGAPSHPRFRVPVMPFLSIYAGVGGAWLATTVGRRWRACRGTAVEAESEETALCAE